MISKHKFVESVNGRFLLDLVESGSGKECVLVIGVAIAASEEMG